MSDIRDRCLLCDSTTQEILDLGAHPYADTFIPPERLDRREAIWPLRLALCPACGQVQTVIPTSPWERYVESEYAYTSGNSAFARDHWDGFAAWAWDRFGLRPRDFVVEIGSNDGYLLRRFQERGASVHGIDASPAMAKLAEDRGVPTSVGVFDGSLVAYEFLTAADGMLAQLMVANNVLNHAEDPLRFLRNAERLLAPGAAVVFEVPSWADTIRNGKFDQVYHEHVSYFTARAIRCMVGQTPFALESIEPVDYHGGSYRVVCRRIGETVRACEEIWRFEGDEKGLELLDPKTYIGAFETFCGRRDRLMHQLYALRVAGVPLVGVGAAAKGNTLLTFCGLNASMLVAVLDGSPRKQGRWTPGTRIPIIPDEILGESRGNPVGALILAWNIGPALKAKLLALNSAVQFLSFYEG